MKNVVALPGRATPDAREQRRNRRNERARNRREELRNRPKYPYCRVGLAGMIFKFEVENDN
jgi:hypothetical protein